MSDEEVRITDPKTGGQKGQKPAQLGALDPKALEAVARVAGFGAMKYDRYNFARGYDWSLSYDAMQRHLMAFWDGQDDDEESGLPHLAHATWHGLALLTFALRGRGNDNRIHNFLAEADAEAKQKPSGGSDWASLRDALRRGVPDITPLEQEVDQGIYLGPTIVGDGRPCRAYGCDYDHGPEVS